jgi:hypothetical protein
MYGLQKIKSKFKFLMKGGKNFMNTGNARKYAKIFTEIDGYKVVTQLCEWPINAEATRAKLNAEVDPENYKKLAPEIYKRTMEELFFQKAVYLSLGENAVEATKKEFEALSPVFAALKTSERMTVSGDTIPDIRGTEYWKKVDGRWEKRKIEKIGVHLSADEYTQDSLGEEFQKEIAVQNEAERLAGLTDEAKVREKEAAIEAALTEVDTLERKARIRDIPFDAQKAFKEKVAEIESKYS